MSENENQQNPNSSRERRRRRRKRRIIYIALFLLISYGFVWVLQQRATTTVLFVRGAETVNGVADASLSAAGQARAQDLVGPLSIIGGDSAITGIYVSPDRGSRETAAPFAEAEDVYAEVVDLRDLTSLRQRIIETRKGEVVLIVASGSDTEKLVAEFQGGYPIQAIGDQRDNIFVVTIPWFGKERLLRFKYGKESYLTELSGVAANTQGLDAIPSPPVSN